MLSVLAAASLFLACSASITGPEAAATTDADRTLSGTGPAVQLVRVRSIIMGTPAGENRAFWIAVKNLSPTKEVYVHQKMADGTWRDNAAIYKGTSENGFEIWEQTLGGGLTNGSSPLADEFCLYMKANGINYWDNNGGKNYKIALGSGDLLGPAVNVLQDTSLANRVNWRYLWASENYTYFEGRVLTRNLQPMAKVNIVYTFDHWKTTLVVPAQLATSYTVYNEATIASPNANNVQAWTWSVRNDEALSTIEYAIAYDVGSSTYWDNNFGKNYLLTTPW